MLRQFTENLITLIVVVDPIGSIPIFLHATAGLAAHDRRKVAFTAVAVIGVLLALLLAGRIQRYLGTAGIMVVTQIMGLVLASFAVQQMLDGVLVAVGRSPH